MNESTLKYCMLQSLMLCDKLWNEKLWIKDSIMHTVHGKKFINMWWTNTKEQQTITYYVKINYLRPCEILRAQRQSYNQICIKYISSVICFFLTLLLGTNQISNVAIHVILPKIGWVAFADTSQKNVCASRKRTVTCYHH